MLRQLAKLSVSSIWQYRKDTLAIDVYDQGGRWIYSIPLMPLNEDEYCVDAGRFARFCKHRCWQHKVMISNASEKSFGDIVNWVDENTGYSWAIEAEPISVSRLNIIFSFEREGDAVLFALMWQ